MTTYDEVPYDTEANADAHPRAMATLARMYGVAAADPSKASVLEIACGNGEHLISAAAYMPDARFVGFDLSERAIETGRAMAKDVPNVTLTVSDVQDANIARTFDYVVAHGLYSWVDEPVRTATLAKMRAALAPNGVGFVSVNALPGWETRRALRWLGRAAAARHVEPQKKVEAALAAIRDVTREPLASFARTYEQHAVNTTPPGAPYCRYVLHDLLAERNDPFSLADMEKRCAAAGLRIVGEAPMRAARGFPEFPGLAADLDRSGLPFLQLLVVRDDVRVDDAPTLRDDMFVWCDFVHEGGGIARTAGGARARIADGDPLWPAVEASPGFVRVGDMPEITKQAMWEAIGLGVLKAVVDPPAIAAKPSDKPRVAPLVLARARAAKDDVILVDALHRKFRVKHDEVALVRRLDGETSVTASPQLTRLGRHGFLIA